ncbi:MAG TPA: hypothetical protein V6D07_16085 [Trichocoleus sp.]
MLDQQDKMARLLRITLLEEGPLSRVVYENQLEDSIDRWHIGLQISGEEFLFAVAERSEEIAMVLIETKDKRLYINEAARAKLADIWAEGYSTCIGHLIPLLAEDLAEGVTSVTGVQHVS